MRWEDALEDVAAMADAEARADLDTEVADRVRRERARVRVVDRLRRAAREGASLRLSVRGTGDLVGAVQTVGSDWLLLAGSSPGRSEAIVALAAVEGVAGLPVGGEEPGTESVVDARLGLGYALRVVSRDRAEVQVTTVAGRVHHGVLDAVGADYLELTEHPPGEPRERGSSWLVPLASVATVSRASGG